MNKRPKLKDLADELGVSITTISRALNDKSDINLETKRKILDLANQMNYRPNKLAVSLRKNQSANMIGVIVPTVNHYFFSAVLKGIMNTAHQEGFLVLVGESVHSNTKEKKILDDFIEYGVSGILMAPSRTSSFEDNVIPILHRRIPIVIMDRMYKNYEGNYVLSNDFQGAYNAVDHLIRNGYRRIAHIGSTDAESIGLERQRGYRRALQSNGIEINDSYIIVDDINDTELSVEIGYNAAKALFDLDVPPDAIFTVTDDVAIGVYEFCKQKGIQIPYDLGVVGFSNSQISKYLSPKLTTVEQNGVSMGEHGFSFLKHNLHSNGQVYQKVFDSNLIVRGSSTR